MVMIPRFVVNLIIMGGSALGKAFLGAYRESIERAAREAGKTAAQHITRNAGGGVSSLPRMSASEAKKILGIDQSRTNADDVVKRFQKLWEANDPTKGGSQYLRDRVEGAKHILDEHIKKGGS